MERIPKKSIVIFLSFLILFLYFYKTPNKENNKKENKERYPSTPKIEEYIFGYQNTQEILSTFKNWENLAPDLVDVKNYGDSEKYFYIKICNEYKPGKYKILVTACIHGNEPLSTSTIIAYAGNLLSSYGKNEEITKIINDSTIYFVPVVSPDTYPHSRNVNGVDPNRDFPTLDRSNKVSVEPVECLKNLFLNIKPNSVLAGHTYGRVFLIPWGDNRKDNKNIDDYKKIASKMCELSNYNYKRACELYGRPIFGTEIDWYNRNGSFAMVMEFGNHQRKPSLEETKKEFTKTASAFLYFLEESPKIQIIN